jgi:hypothetical protein
MLDIHLDSSRICNPSIHSGSNDYLSSVFNSHRVLKEWQCQLHVLSPTTACKLRASRSGGTWSYSASCTWPYSAACAGSTLPGHLNSLTSQPEEWLDHTREFQDKRVAGRGQVVTIPTKEVGSSGLGYSSSYNFANKLQ